VLGHARHTGAAEDDRLTSSLIEAEKLCLRVVQNWGSDQPDCQSKLVLLPWENLRSMVSP
jgi:hypothetical protein